MALGLAASDALPVARLAAHTGVRVLGVDKIPGLSAASLRQLTVADPGSWSAMLVHFGDQRVVVMNTAHSVARQSSFLMHECAHVVLNHEPKEAGHAAEGLLMVSGYRPQQEAEADWLAGTLLLPRVALLAIVLRAIPQHVATRGYSVSEDMLRMRLDRTGVNMQMRRRVA